MSSWNCSQKVCASCRYWCGMRNIDSKLCSSQALEQRGTCVGPEGSFKGFETYEERTCDQWENLFHQ